MARDAAFGFKFITSRRTDPYKTGQFVEFYFIITAFIGLHYAVTIRNYNPGNRFALTGYGSAYQTINSKQRRGEGF
ncbi:hypothetical protein D3C85_1138100 [compost metagenome]